MAATRASGRVTFWSRSKQRLWTKGETSGHFLELRGIAADCDGDTLLILAQPSGPACHLGHGDLFRRERRRARPPRIFAFLGNAAGVIAQRIADAAAEAATRPSCWPRGTRRIAQKVGEEGLELALASVAQSDAESSAKRRIFLYHLLLLLKVKDLSLAQVVAELEARHKGRTAPR